jgi:hypothetical protein
VPSPIYVPQPVIVTQPVYVPTPVVVPAPPALDVLSDQLRQAVCQLRGEINANFTGSPSYCQLRDDLAAMEGLAGQLPELARCGNVALLRSDLQQIARYVPEVRSIVSAMNGPYWVPGSIQSANLELTGIVQMVNNLLARTC